MYRHECQLRSQHCFQSKSSAGGRCGKHAGTKALELQAQQAAQLIAALPQTAPSAPAHLGQNIDVRV